MTIPIQSLPSASSPLNGSAYVVIKDGATDKKATINQVRTIDISALTSSPAIAATDLIMIGRGTDTYKTAFSNVGFVPGTKTWFYTNTAPIGWTHDATITDTVLGVKGGTDYVTGGTDGGSWQQDNHSLTESELAPHTHTYNPSGTTTNTGANPRWFPNSADNKVNVNRFGETKSAGSGNGHNHGAVWRPLASVGIVCVKG